MSQNVNRVDHVMWICKPENQAAYVEQLSKLCRVKFYGPVEKDNLGVRLYINWAAGLEVIAPTSQTNPISKPLRDHLAARGEGLLGLVFGVADIDDARRHAQALGYEPSGLIENSGDEPYAQETEVMKEIMLGNVLNSLFVFGEIKLSDDPLR